jgi:hypothetical protein
MKGCRLFLGFQLLLPFAAFAGNIQINGVCVVGASVPVDGAATRYAL